MTQAQLAAVRVLIRCTVVGLAIAAITLPTTSVAKDKRKKKPREPNATLITAVGPTSISIKHDKVEKTVAITPATEIYVRDDKATVAALQIGMAVNITLAMDGASASRISATDAPVLRGLPDQKSKPKKRR
jgi:hypothetical protein